MQRIEYSVYMKSSKYIIIKKELKYKAYFFKKNSLSFRGGSIPSVAPNGHNSVCCVKII